MLLGGVLFFGPGFPGWLLLPAGFFSGWKKPQGFPGFFCCRQVFFSGCKTENPRLYDDHQAKAFEKVGTKKWSLII